MMIDVGLRDDILIWRQQVGLFRAYNDPSRLVKVGTPGLADLGAIVQVTITPDMVGKTIGVALQPEVKTLKGKQREDQESWEAAVKARGGLYRMVRCTDDLLKMIDDAKTGNW